jgi:hypothetical protein
MFAKVYEVPERLEQFLNAMSGISAGNFRRLRGEVRLRPLPQARATWAARPALACFVAARRIRTCVRRFDLPPVEPIASGASPRPGCPRVDARRATSSADPLPEADVITMGMILHDWNLERKST